MSQLQVYYNDTAILPVIGSSVHGYKLLKVITNTANSIVMMAKDTKSGDNFAIKFIKCIKKAINRVDEEVKLMSEIKCPYIVESHDIFDYPPYKCVVMPLAITDLNNISALTKTNRLPEESVKEIIYCSLKALKYLHDRNICHRDIKPDNLLVLESNETEEVKLCDLGFAKKVTEGEKCTEYLGTLKYAAPEVISGVPYDLSVDIWSMGVTLYTLLCGEPPFPTRNERETRTCIMTCSYFFPANLWRGISREAKDLICHMIKKNPAARYTVDQCLNHPWFTQVGSSSNSRSTKELPDISFLQKPLFAAHLVE